MREAGGPEAGGPVVLWKGTHPGIAVEVVKPPCKALGKPLGLRWPGREGSDCLLELFTLGAGREGAACAVCVPSL